MTGILFFFLQSLWYDIAQQQSAIIYLSLIRLLAIKWHNNGIAYFIVSYFGNGLPLHKFDNAHAPCLIMFVYFILACITWIKFITPPFLIIESLWNVQSLAIFPIAQIAC